MPSKPTLKEYLIQNPIDRTLPDPYAKVAKLFNTTKETVRVTYKTLRNKPQKTINNGIQENVHSNRFADHFSQTGDQAQTEKYTAERVKTLDDLVRVCEIDQTTWEIISWECTKWEVGRKDKQVNWQIKEGVVIEGNVQDTGKIHVEPLYRVKAKLRLRQVDKDLSLQKDLLLKELFTQAPKVADKLKEQIWLPKKPLLLNLSLYDVHFGKMAHEEEAGEDYDLKIAANRYREAVDNLISKVNIEQIGRIMFPIGQDLFNVDNINKTTANFTPQDTDTRFHKMVKFVKNLLIETVDYLIGIAPVDIIVVPGNHDTTVTFLCGEILDAYYSKNENVTVDNGSALRKYYTFGKTAFLLTHGDKEKHNDLGMIFAAERPHIWSQATQRYIHIGHYHHNKKINYLSNNEFQGFTLQILPSLSPADAWHCNKGFSALRQAKAFLYDELEGLVAELTYTAK